MLLLHMLGRKNLQLRNVARQNQVESPVSSDTDLPIQPGKLRQIDCTPEEPGKDAFDFDSKYFGDC